MTLLAAHRGGGALWSEKSLTAFRVAIALGVDLVEIDVRPSADGQVVVIDDGVLDRTTSGHGARCSSPWTVDPSRARAGRCR